MFKRTEFVIIITIVLHLLGDLVLQNVLSPYVPPKRDSVLGMLIHALYADGAAFIFLGFCVGGIRGAATAFVLGVGSHFMVDTVLSFNKTILWSMFDQALHVVVFLSLTVAYRAQPIVATVLRGGL